MRPTARQLIISDFSEHVHYVHRTHSTIDPRTRNVPFRSALLKHGTKCSACADMYVLIPGRCEVQNAVSEMAEDVYAVKKSLGGSDVVQIYTTESTCQSANKSSPETKGKSSACVQGRECRKRRCVNEV